MAIPLLGLASILGREYANSQPTVQQRDDILKVLSPQTYYGNQLIQYLADKFNPEIGSGLNRAQNVSDYYGEKLYYDSRPENQLSQEEYDKQMAALSAKTSTPESQIRFENTLRDMEYGTVNPVDFQYVGPQTEDSVRFQLGEAMLPRVLESVPVESNFTPAQLDALRERIYGITPEVGPQQEPSQAPGGGGFGGAGGDFMPQGGGGFMPQGGGKDDFDIQAEYEQYLRGGLIQRRR
jgi:hypothetical protein